jgi:hypothetical protein
VQIDEDGSFSVLVEAMTAGKNNASSMIFVGSLASPVLLHEEGRTSRISPEGGGGITPAAVAAFVSRPYSPFGLISASCRTRRVRRSVNQTLWPTDVEPCEDPAAEGEGFEPPVPAKGTTVFETAPFNHSGTPPRCDCRKVPAVAVEERKYTASIGALQRRSGKIRRRLTTTVRSAIYGSEDRADAEPGTWNETHGIGRETVARAQAQSHEYASRGESVTVAGVERDGIGGCVTPVARQPVRR